VATFWLPQTLINGLSLSFDGHFCVVLMPGGSLKFFCVNYAIVVLSLLITTDITPKIGVTIVKYSKTNVIKLFA